MPGDRFERDGLTWEYVGEAATADLGEHGELVALGFADARGATAGVILPPEGQLWAASRIDAVGRLWRVVDVAPGTVEDMVYSYDEAVAREYGLDLRYSRPWDGAEEWLEPMEVDFTGWSRGDCDGVSGDDFFIFDPDGRQQIGHGPDSFSLSFTTNARKAEVLLYQFDPVSENFENVCSATVIEATGSVLTAAHCVTDGADPFPPGDFLACTRSNHASNSGVECWGFSTLTVASGWDGGFFGFANDFAILDRDVGSGRVNVPLSSHTNGELEGFGEVMMLGYPLAFSDGADHCVDNFHSDLAIDEFDGIFINQARALRVGPGAIVNVLSGTIRTQTDVWLGDSGGMFAVDDEGVMFHAATEGGHVGTPTQYNAGANTATNRTFILAAL